MFHIKIASLLSLVNKKSKGFQHLCVLLQRKSTTKNMWRNFKDI